MSLLRPRILLSRRNLVRLVALILALLLFRAVYLYSSYVCPSSLSLLPRPADSLANAYRHASFAPLDLKDGTAPQLVLSNEEHMPDKVLVVSSMKADDTAWLHQYFPDWQRVIYVMDDPTAKYTVARNKGRESTAYLTYIIDHYHGLPETVVFLHALRYQWHNEDPMYDGVPPVKNLQIPYVQQHGYANLRCTWSLGCPAELRPNTTLTTLKEAMGAVAKGDSDRAHTEAAYTQAFLELFPGSQPGETPEAIGIPCGAQFALSRRAIRKRPRQDYIRYRDWLWNTELPDNVSGRILEYSWHIIMGKPFEYCPDAKSCFCDKFGLCDLTCPEAGRCEKRFQLPQYATIPKGWPEQGSGANGFPALGWAD